MQYVEIEPFYLVGISVQTTNENNQAATDIAELWQRFLNEQIAESIPDKISQEILSLYTDYEGDYMKPYLAIIGCKVSSLDNVPKGLVGRQFEGGTYVNMSARGDLMKGLIVNQWTEIWKMDLKRSYTADFELFGEKAQNPSDAEVDFFVAVNE